MMRKSAAVFSFRNGNPFPQLGLRGRGLFTLVITNPGRKKEKEKYLCKYCTPSRRPIPLKNVKERD